MERMGPLDASFLWLEDGITHMHIASCAVFAGPAPPYADVISTMAAKLNRVPRYRQMVRFVPFELGRPVWVDDPHFNLEYHVRHTALPSPGGPTELRQLMGRLMSQELDRTRPLWEAWMVEGLEDDRWVLITKIHHSMVDGVAGTDLLAAVLDQERHVPDPAVEEWVPEPQPSGFRLGVDALVHLATSPFEQLRAAQRVLRTPHRTITQLRDLAGGLRSYAREVMPTEPSSFVGSIGPNRRWTWASADLDDLKTIRRTFGGTVNDVILSVITAGLRDLLVSRGQTSDETVVRSLIPVSVRSEAERGTYNNRVSAMFADLPVEIEDPVLRLASIRRQMESLKGSHQTLAGESLVALGELTPFVAIATTERVIMSILRKVPQHSINTVTTNVAGPQFPLFLAGCEMIDFLPFVPIAHGMRVGLAIVSYNGRVTFGITGDYDSASDIDVIGHGIEDAVAELVKLADSFSG